MGRPKKFTEEEMLTNFQKWKEQDLDYIRRKGEYHPEVKGAQIYQDTIKQQTKYKGREIRLQEMNFARQQWPFIKPFLVFIGLLFLFIGPGLSIVTSLVSQLNIWMWIGLIIVILAIWRNK